jgi:C-terminal processing protease CtpA/Prc
MQIRFLLLLILFGIFNSCKKNVDTPAPTPSDSTALATMALDSALIDANSFYLWYNQIPSTFNARSYSDPNAVITAIRAYSIEPGFGTAPVDRWSFGVLQSDWNQLSGGIGTAASTTATGDFGLNVFFLVDGDLRVKLVYPQSPAGQASIQRGWKITAINGSTNITIANATFIVNAVYYSASTAFTFVKPDGSSVNMTLNATTYPEPPVYLDTVYNYGSKTIGYMVINSFLGDTSQLATAFQNTISYFNSQNVTDIVVDLRYNGGGYVSAQQNLANYLAPAAANNSLMMKETFNDKHQSYNSSLYFKKKGLLSPNHILFIVSEFTASASELLINNLKPYMTVKLIGPGNTDGKPVGFFPIADGDWYVFPVSFRSTNSAGNGEYFNGFTPDAITADGLTKNWGDISESCLAEAIKYITTGTFTPQSIQNYKEDPAVLSGNHLLDHANFKGMVDSRGIK